MKYKLIYSARNLDGRLAYAACQIDGLYIHDQPVLAAAKRECWYHLNKLIGDGQMTEFRLHRIETLDWTGKVVSVVK